MERGAAMAGEGRRAKTGWAGVAAIAALALAGCGDGGVAGPEDARAADPASPGKTVAKAGDDAATLRCPPKVRDDLTGPDVLGVRLGMTHDEALAIVRCALGEDAPVRSEEHTSELQSLMRISYAVFCLKKKTANTECT